MRWGYGRLLAATLLLASLPALPVAAQATDSESESEGAALRLARSLDDAALRSVALEVLKHNPELAAAAARARAMALEAPQVRSLPDPALGLTAFVASPETRVGPQRLKLGLSQRLPWFGKLQLKEQAAVLEAGGFAAELEAKRVRAVTETRRLWYELAYLARHQKIVEGFHHHLVQHEEIARTRYATGSGLGQAVVKVQAELTRAESQLLDIQHLRSELAARLEELRSGSSWESGGGDGPATARLPDLFPVVTDRDQLERRALELRPELAAAAARIARAEALQRLAEKERRPDLTIGFTFTIVEPREDLPGQLQPPPDNGSDVFGLLGSVTLPVRRQRLRAALDEAAELRGVAEQERRAIRAAIGAELGELAVRIPLAWSQLRLLEDVLIVQAEEAMKSARAGYITGTLNALDLLHAHHVVFEARTAAARAAADYALFLARLEGAIAAPLKESSS